MFACLETTTSSRRISAVAFLALACLFSPAYVIFAWPSANHPMLQGLAISGLCLMLAWFNRRKPVRVKRLW